MDSVLETRAKWEGAGNFNSVQGILDRNKILISEINNNHEARTADGLDRNYHLIQELNSNLSKIVELYKELSSSFLTMMEEESGKPDMA